ncbi:MAG: hypothetical protein FWF97_03580 [Alphaproteobacteria bacterium]|nr:hypothetical protein [Alphaproteobacteria bacterium]
MKKIMRSFGGFAFASLLLISTANAADWWTQPTICRLDPNKCYPSMGTGFDAQLWDTGALCWGLKLVCGGALAGGSSADQPQPMTKSQISSGQVNSDFDLVSLDSVSKCWGARQTRNNGSQAMVNGGWVNVFCAGALGGGDERLANGEIMLLNASAQPKCLDLAPDGWVIALQGGKCYGKRYAWPEYHIECNAAPKDLPDRIIALNGARDYITGAPVPGFPATTSDANSVFDSMYAISQQKKLQHFGK